jgi:hypothetical protein
MARVRIGTMGWQFENWNKSYYPEDIPPQWKLGFYANDFTAVVVPESLWVDVELNQLAEMAEDLHEDFALYFQINSLPPSDDKINQVKTDFSENFYGFLVEAGIDFSPAAIGDNGFIFPSGMEKGDCSWSVLEKVTQSDCVIRVSGEPQIRYLKEQFEQARGKLDLNRDMLVLIDSPQPDNNFVKQLRTLLELMMIA